MKKQTIETRVEELEREVWKKLNEYFPTTTVSTCFELNQRSKALVLIMLSKELGVQGHADYIRKKGGKK